MTTTASATAVVAALAVGAFVALFLFAVVAGWSLLALIMRRAWRRLLPRDDETDRKDDANE